MRRLKRHIAGYEELARQVNKISIYPNPSSGKLIINASEFANTIKSIFITDIYAKWVSEKTTNLHNNSVLAIDLSKYKSGIYFLRLDIEYQGLVSRKIIKQ